MNLQKMFSTICSILILLTALPLLLWCLNLIGNASLDYDYAGAGCFAAEMVYVFYMPPLFILTILYLFGVGWSKKPNG